jgi:hypothetical protein
MKSTIETLRVTWKYIRWAGQGRTPVSYCTYIIENKKHRHKLKALDGSKLFDLLKITRIYKNQNQCDYELLVDVRYNNNRLTYITNPRRM